jgi:hypothetical protein
MDKDQIDLVLKFLGVIILLFVILFILTWSGVVKCKDFTPYWCSVYDFVVGSPRVLVAYGDSGLGDPEKLELYLKSPDFVGVGSVSSQHIDKLFIGNLKQYKLVIVEHAKEMPAEKLLMFMDYVNKYGGRLVWVGDSGTGFPEDEVREIEDENSQKKLIGNQWVRVVESGDEFKLVSFDEFLGIKYLDNYCNQINCTDAMMSVGRLEAEATGEHPLIYGSSPVLNFKIKKDRDFSLVRQIPNSPGGSMVVLNLNHLGSAAGKTVQVPQNVPMIITSGTGLGERVAYYAYPPEYFLEDNNYFIYLKNLYYGMMGR